MLVKLQRAIKTWLRGLREKKLLLASKKDKRAPRNCKTMLHTIDRIYSKNDEYWLMFAFVKMTFFQRYL